MVLIGATTIKIDRLYNEVVNELVVFYGAAASAGVGPAAAALVLVLVLEVLLLLVLMLDNTK